MQSFNYDAVAISGDWSGGFRSFTVRHDDQYSRFIPFDVRRAAEWHAAIGGAL